MELRQHAAVLWRWRKIVGAGAVLALLIALLVTFKPTGGPGIAWRDTETLSSTSTLLVTQPGFPWGRVILPTAPDGSPAPARPATPGHPATPAFASPERFGDLALIYAYLGNSQQVRALIAPRPAEHRISIQTVSDQVTDTGLPLLTVATTGHAAASAVRLNGAVIAALRTYLERQQVANAIPESQRVQLQVLEPPAKAELIDGRSVAPPFVAFLLVLAAAVGVAYILENLRRSGEEEEAARNGANGQRPASTVVMPWTEPLHPDPHSAPPAPRRRSAPRTKTEPSATKRTGARA